jgi:hypothetical protein
VNLGHSPSSSFGNNFYRLPFNPSPNQLGRPAVAEVLMARGHEAAATVEVAELGEF